MTEETNTIEQKLRQELIETKAIAFDQAQQYQIRLATANGQLELASRVIGQVAEVCGMDKGEAFANVDDVVTAVELLASPKDKSSGKRKVKIDKSAV